ncbi:hypothetical protein FN846DRAFT_111117 [Sphaerosporella brunnea]|uniref:F-box domain-containing protein n=1 Tax=Sphaerosporella brunnea TaxID=1250544 RepID=A0A5J5ESH6_9PEZI|nr:hypothetical protein FN846DRAFT_111117 [Sphaerosporella brunnea]
MPTQLLSLPPELLLELAEHLSAAGLHRLILCNRYLHSLLNAHLYCLFSSLAARKAIFYEDHILLGRLLSLGLDSIQPGLSLLKYAVVYSNAKATRILLEAGADPREEPLLLFYPMIHQNWEILGLLLRFGADPELGHSLEKGDDNLYTPRQVAWLDGTPEVRRMLEEAIEEGKKWRVGHTVSVDVRA